MFCPFSSSREPCQEGCALRMTIEGEGECCAFAAQVRVISANSNAVNSICSESNSLLQKIWGRIEEI